MKNNLKGMVKGMLSDIVKKLSKACEIMKYDIKRWYILGTIFTVLLGTLLHFIYQWSGNNSIVGIFGAVNESTWEHLKLLFWPQFIFFIGEYIYIRKNFENFYSGKTFRKYIMAKAISFYLGIALIFSLFYTYTGIVGKNILIVDIVIFIMSVTISQCIGYKVISGNYKFGIEVKIVSMVSIALLVFVFVLFTFQPPEMPLFQDPNTGTYGV